MADTTHDAEDGFHEIHLTGKQLVFLFMATTVVSVVIFLCGVLVGRSARTDRAGEAIDEPIGAAAAPSTADGASSPPASIEPPAPPAEGADQLTYARRLEGADAPKETLKPAEEPAPAPPPAPAPAPAAPARTTGARPGEWVVQLVAIKDGGAASSIVERLQKKGYPAFLVRPESGSPAPVFKVQVGRFADRREAEQVAARLKKEERFQPWIQR